MNLIILSSIPGFVLAMIIVEAIIMVLLGGFLIYDIVRSKLKARKKEKELEEEKRRMAREKSISLETSEEDAIMASGVSELEYLRRMNKEQKEYIALLEKKMNLKKELEEHDTDTSTMEYNEGESDDDPEFDEFWNSIPSKDGIVLQELPTGEDKVITDDEEDEDETIEDTLEEPKETIEESLEEKDETIEEVSEAIDALETKDNSSSGVVITASSLKAPEVDLEEKRKQQEKIMAFLKEQEALEAKEEKIDTLDEVTYDFIDPWYCQAKPFVKKKKKYNNF